MDDMRAILNLFKATKNVTDIESAHETIKAPDDCIKENDEKIEGMLKEKTPKVSFEDVGEIVKKIKISSRRDVTTS